MNEQSKFWYIDLDKIDNILEGNWWHRIRTINFGFQEKIMMRKHCKVFDDDILINKQILEGERLPSKNYFMIFDGQPYTQKNKDIKTLMVEKLLKFIEKYNKFPFACSVTNIYKNGNVQITYNPTDWDKFALRITPKMCELHESIPNEEIGEFFNSLDTIDNNPLQSKNTFNKKKVIQNLR